MRVLEKREGIGGYIGSDALCALDAALETPGARLPFLLVDTGTNSEVLLATRERVFCASAAAGPALEGGDMSCGMAAGKGAIHAFHLERGRLVPSVIGESMPLGICGSGIVDLVAPLLEMGGVDPSGTLCPEGAPGAGRERHKEILERVVHVPLHADPRFLETFITSLSIAPWE